MSLIRLVANLVNDLKDGITLAVADKGKDALIVLDQRNDFAHALDGSLVAFRAELES